MKVLVKNRLGQSLVELIVAIAIIEIGIFSVWSLFLVNFNSEREAEMRIVGVNLAREGVEVIKNIRDTNWRKAAANVPVDSNNPESQIWPWDQYLEPGVYSVNYDSEAPMSADYQNLYFNAQGFFTNIESDSPSPYKRTVTLKDICCSDSSNDFKCDNTDFFTLGITETCAANELKVGLNIISEVSWQISGKSRRVVIEDNIYNWQ